MLFVIEPTLYNDKVAQAEAELKTAQAQLEYARNNYSRMKEAVKSDAVSQIQVLQSESSVTEGVAAVSNAEAALSTARTNLGYCYVRAPLTGQSASRQWISAVMSAVLCSRLRWLLFIRTIRCMRILMLLIINGWRCR